MYLFNNSRSSADMYLCSQSIRVLFFISVTRMYIYGVGVSENVFPTGIRLPPFTIAILSTVTHSHPEGNSNGSSSSIGETLRSSFLISFEANNSALSCIVCSNITDAGSSFGSCGTKRPEIASWRILLRSCSAVIVQGDFGV